MKKFTKIIAATTAVLLTLGAASCTKSSYPDFINPSESIDRVDTSEKYVINVQSEGGMKLDGVKVAAMRGGQVIRRGISIDGKIELGVALGEYELVIDETSLPAGYYLPETTYKTNASSREEVTIKIPSALIPATSNAASTYALGTIMKDFTFTDCRGAKHRLSEILKVKKAVALNFWYSGCAPCRAEFPHVQRAYASRTDIEFLAICSTHQGDTNTVVENYKTENGLTFPMGIDTLGLNNAFGVDAFPTTVVIDRYGLIAYRSKGTEPSTSFWTKLFNDFCSDDYVQKLSADGNTDPSNPGGQEREKPTYTMPASADIAAVANGNRVSATYRADEDEFSWPWLVSNEGYIYSSNTGKHNSYSILYADIDMKKDEVLAIEYNVSSEADCDYLHVFIDGSPISGDGWSATDGWVSADLYVADRDEKVELAFAYRKDDADGDEIGEDVAKVRNIHIYDASAIRNPIDVMRPAASGEVIDYYKYGSYVNAVYNPRDGFYHKDSENGALLYICLNNLTPWSDLHTGTTSQSNGETYYSTLYYLTYYRYAVKGENFAVMLGGENLTSTVTEFFTIQGYMDAPNYLIPVTPKLKTWAEKFVERYERDNGKASHGDEWLEFCFYYDHYGPGHAKGDNCAKYDDPTRGLTMNNSYRAYEKSELAAMTDEQKSELNPNAYNKDTGRNKASINFAMETQENGTYYEFTASEAGVYQIQSYLKGCSTTAAKPGVMVFDKDGNFRDMQNDVRDHDQFVKQVYTDEDEDQTLPDTAYQGFNHYITLKAGETVYLKLLTAMSTVSYYDFDITYLGESYDKMLIASTGGGAWTGESGTDYLGVKYALVGDKYYVADSEGNADMSKPLYIDMIFGSYLYSELVTYNGKTYNYNFAPLKDIIDDGVVYNDRNFAFGSSMQSMLQSYLGTATAKDKDDTYYGMVQADVKLVEILNVYFDHYVHNGRGEGNGWLAFACYMEHYGA